MHVHVHIGISMRANTCACECLWVPWSQTWTHKHVFENDRTKHISLVNVTTHKQHCESAKWLGTYSHEPNDIRDIRMCMSHALIIHTCTCMSILYIHAHTLLIVYSYCGRSLPGPGIRGLGGIIWQVVNIIKTHLPAVIHYTGWPNLSRLCF